MSVEQFTNREKKRRVHHFGMLRQRNIPITMVTAYDYPTGLVADEAGADAVLVGDSLGMVALGYPDTLQVTMEDMVHHSAAVRRGVKRAFLVTDMPFMSYQESPEQAVRNAGILVREGAAEAVKLEGGRAIVPQVERIVAAGIPVMGHVGLTPQSIHRLGGYRVQGRQDEDAERIKDEALALESAGAFAIVLEALAPDLAAEITQALAIPTIGIGAGRECSGQILVMSDIIGAAGTGSPPKFVKQYAAIHPAMVSAVAAYCSDVRERRFPEEKHEY